MTGILEPVVNSHVSAIIQRRRPRFPLRELRKERGIVGGKVGGGEEDNSCGKIRISSLREGYLDELAGKRGQGKK